MMDLVEQDLDSLPNVIKVLSCSLASKNEAVVQKGAKILAKVLDVGGKMQVRVGEEALAILSKCLVAVEFHPKLAKNLGHLVRICYKDEYFKLIEDLKIVKEG